MSDLPKSEMQLRKLIPVLIQEKEDLAKQIAVLAHSYDLADSSLRDALDAWQTATLRELKLNERTPRSSEK